MQPLPPNEPRSVGPYRVIAELGRGAMGRVLLGIGPDGRPVAVKLIREWLTEDDEFRARFRREVTASQRVSGAYTAAVLDAGPDDPVPWLASEFLPGPTLRSAVDAAGPLPEETVLRLAAGLASALASVHRAGVIHRDLKPGNVILAADGPRVIDFGIARAADRTGTDLTRTGGVVGTPGFMSPEQADSEPLTAASDMFSLGSVLVMACTGSSPFAAASTLRTLNNVVRAEPDLAGVPERVRRVAERCLVREAAERPSPAEVLALIGPVAPSSRPWPEAVSAMADRQHRELASLLDSAGEDTTLIDTGQTMVTDPNRATWVSAPPAAPPPTPPAGSPGDAGGGAPGRDARAAGTGPAVRPIAPPPVRPTTAPRSSAATTVAVLICLGIIAAIAWPMLNDESDPTGTIDDPTESETTAEEEDAWTEEETTDAYEVEEETEEAAPQWNEEHSGLGIGFGFSTDDSDTCEYKMVDFDDIDGGSIYVERPTSESIASYTDLVWDPCTGTDMEAQSGSTNYLYTSPTAYGAFYDSWLTAAECWNEIDADYPELDWGIDTWAPEESSFETGMVLCLYTDYEQIVLAEVTSVEPETSSDWLWIEFDVSIWAWY
ncbi:serine/threonine-protein kinase [Glycomyces tenuis]|uniref:serine/threonine-protein kinase n=1 Tax=Glycomyces tenuis TaxID=58116 RepID=UPI0004128D4D|nr:serine/threonine-protein kinase [Glycomyces tenuis]